MEMHVKLFDARYSVARKFISIHGVVVFVCIVAHVPGNPQRSHKAFGAQSWGSFPAWVGASVAAPLGPEIRCCHMAPASGPEGELFGKSHAEAAAQSRLESALPSRKMIPERRRTCHKSQKVPNKLIPKRSSRKVRVEHLVRFRIRSNAKPDLSVSRGEKKKPRHRPGLAPAKRRPCEGDRVKGKFEKWNKARVRDHHKHPHQRDQWRTE